MLSFRGRSCNVVIELASMPRTARLHSPGGIFHLISRTLNGEFLITKSEHRNRYLVRLADALKHTDAVKVAVGMALSGHPPHRSVREL